MDDLALVRRMAEYVRDATVKYADTNLDYAEIIRRRARDVTRRIDMVAEGALDDAIMAEGIAARVISEELGERVVPNSTKPGLTLLCDPVDGSNNFISGLPYFCTTIAISNKTDLPRFADIEAAAVSSPHMGTFYAAKGKGAFIDDRPIHTGRNDGKPVYAIYAYGSGAIPAGLVNLQEKECIVRTMGSIALDICMVASGPFDAVIDSRKKVSGYDVMAACLILREAGGTCSMADGSSFDSLPLSAEGLSIVCGANAEIQDRLVKDVFNR